MATQHGGARRQWLCAIRRAYLQPQRDLRPGRTSTKAPNSGRARRAASFSAFLPCATATLRHTNTHRQPVRRWERARRQVGGGLTGPDSSQDAPFARGHSEFGAVSSRGARRHTEDQICGQAAGGHVRLAAVPAEPQAPVGGKPGSAGAGGAGRVRGSSRPPSSRWRPPSEETATLSPPRGGSSSE